MEIEVSMPGSYRGSVAIGVVDERARLAFTRGQCHSFAVALSRATGWDIVGVLPAWWETDEGQCEWDHFMVWDRENDLFVDIEGVKTREETEQRWQCIGDVVDEQDIEWWVSRDEFYPLHVEIAETFVPPLLETIASHRKVT